MREYRDWLTVDERSRFTGYRLPEWLERYVNRAEVEHPIDTVIQLVGQGSIVLGGVLIGATVIWLFIAGGTALIHLIPGV